MQPRRAGADACASPVLQTQPKLSKFTLRGLLTLPVRPDIKFVYSIQFVDTLRLCRP